VNIWDGKNTENSRTRLPRDNPEAIKGCPAAQQRIRRASKNWFDEGNAFEAGVVFGVENVKDPSVSEVTTRQFPDHDVPEEYLNQDN